MPAQKDFSIFGRSDYQCPQCASVCQVRNIPFEDQTISFFVSLGLGVYVFEEKPKSIQDVIVVVHCPGNYCLNREKCESIGGYVTTPRSIYGCGRCGAWLFVPKVPFTLQEHVKTTKQAKLAFPLLRRILPDKQLLLNVPFQSTNYRRKEMCVDNIKTIGDVHCPTCKIENIVEHSNRQIWSRFSLKKTRPVSFPSKSWNNTVINSFLQKLST